LISSEEVSQLAITELHNFAFELKKPGKDARLQKSRIFHGGKIL